jgi:hypothetical protein
MSIERQGRQTGSAGRPDQRHRERNRHGRHRRAADNGLGAS